VTEKCERKMEEMEDEFFDKMKSLESLKKNEMESLRRECEERLERERVGRELCFAEERQRLCEEHAGRVQCLEREHEENEMKRKQIADISENVRRILLKKDEMSKRRI
jgi:hypothetical protein